MHTYIQIGIPIYIYILVYASRGMYTKRYRQVYSRLNYLTLTWHVNRIFLGMVKNARGVHTHKATRATATTITSHSVPLLRRCVCAQTLYLHRDQPTDRKPVQPTHLLVEWVGNPCRTVVIHIVTKVQTLTKLYKRIEKE